MLEILPSADSGMLMFQSGCLFIKQENCCFSTVYANFGSKLSGVSVEDSEDALRLYDVEAFAPVMDKETLICSTETLDFLSQ